MSRRLCAAVRHCHCSPSPAPAAPRRTYEAEGHDLQSLLFNFLDELLFAFATEFFVAKQLRITTFDRDNWRIVAEGCAAAAAAAAAAATGAAAAGAAAEPGRSMPDGSATNEPPFAYPWCIILSLRMQDVVHTYTFALPLPVTGCRQGERFDRQRHVCGTEVKAITFSAMQVTRGQGRGWHA